MRIEIVTIFPRLMREFFATSLIGKACEKGVLELGTTDLRQFAEPPHFHVDDYPYGGGPGMVMKAGPLLDAVSEAKKKLPGAHVILMAASGRAFTQARAKELSEKSELIICCGRYEGVDQRAIDMAIDEEISIGDFVMMGGEAAAMAVTEAVCRLLPDVIGNELSCEEESFSERSDGVRLLEWPHYTRPETFRGVEVPGVLRSGDHAKIRAWRTEKALEKTLRLRPDLLKPVKHEEQ